VYRRTIILLCELIPSVIFVIILLNTASPMEQDNKPLLSTSISEEDNSNSLVVENLENNINSNQNINSELDNVPILPKENISDESKKNQKVEATPVVDENSLPPNFYSASKITTELPPENIQSVAKTEISESKEKIEQDIKNELSPVPVSESKQDIEQDTKPERSFSTIEPPTTSVQSVTSISSVPGSESKQDANESSPSEKKIKLIFLLLINYNVIRLLICFMDVNKNKIWKKLLKYGQLQNITRNLKPTFTCVIFMVLVFLKTK